MIDTELHFGAWGGINRSKYSYYRFQHWGDECLKGEVKRRVPGIFILLEICSSTHGPFIFTLMNQMFDF